MRTAENNFISKVLKHKHKILLILFIICFSTTLLIANKSVDKQIERYDYLNNKEIGEVDNVKFHSSQEYQNISDKTNLLILQKDQELVQTYKTATKKVNSIDIYVENTSESGEIIVTLSDNKKTIVTQTFNANEITNVLRLNVEGKEYPLASTLSLSVATKNIEEDKPLVLLTHTCKKFSYRIIGNDKKKNSQEIVLTKSIGISTFYHAKISVALLGVSLIIFIILSASFIKNNKKTNQFLHKFIDKLEKYHLHFVFEFIYFLSIILLFLRFIIYYFYSQQISIPLIILWFFLFAIFALYFITLFKRYKENWAQLFLLVAIPIGLCFLVFMLPDFIPDEPAHFYKTYLTSNFDFSINTSVSVPSDYEVFKITNYNDLWNQLFTSSNYSSNLVEGSATAYSFILYLVPSVGVMIAKLFSLSIYMAYFLARMFNFILFLFLGYKTIKLTPYGKLIFFVLLLNPMMIHQAISVSADVLINAVLIFFIAYVLHIKFREENLKTKDLIILLIFLLFILVSKYAYLPLFGLVLIFFDKIKKLSVKTICVFLLGCGGMFIIYILLNKLTYFEFNGLEQLPQSLINPTEQMKYLLSSPFNFINMIINTLLQVGNFYWFSFFGRYLSWLDLHNSYATYLYIALFFASPFIKEEKRKFGNISKVWLIVLFSGLLSMIVLGLYLTWTPVGSAVAAGVQGRYFLPFAILPLLALSGKKKLIISNPQRTIIGLLLIIHSIVIINIITTMSNV